MDTSETQCTFRDTFSWTECVRRGVELGWEACISFEWGDIISNNQLGKKRSVRFTVFACFHLQNENNSKQWINIFIFLKSEMRWDIIIWGGRSCFYFGSILFTKHVCKKEIHFRKIIKRFKSEVLSMVNQTLENNLIFNLFLHERIIK